MSEAPRLELFKDAKGKVYEVPRAEAEQAARAGWTPATPDDIAAHQARREAGSATGQLKTAASGAASGFVDAVTALPRAASAIASSVAGTEDIAQGMTGRNLLETGAYVAGGQGLPGAQAAQDFAAAERLRAQENPGTAALSSIGGNIAGIGLGGLGGLARGAGAAVTGRLGGGALARVAGAGITGAVEGAPLNLVAAQDQAYIENRQLTGEQAMAALGTGSLIGLGVGGGAKGLSELFSAGAEKVSGALARRAEAAAGETAGADASATQKLLRTSDDHLNKSIEATVGREAIPEAAEYARAGLKGQSLQTIRSELHDVAARDMAAATNESLSSVQRIVDKVDNKGWKLAQVEAHAPSFAADALEQTQAHAAAIRADVHETIAQLGKDAPKTLKGLAAQLDKNEMIVRGATEPAKANLAMDQIRRDLLRTNNAFDRSARQVANVDEADLARFLTQKTGEHYETAQKFLMNAETWGAQGEAQAAVNTARAELIRSQTNAVPQFTQTVRGGEYMGGGVARDVAQAHEGKILSTMRNLGKAEGAVGERAMSEYLTTAKNFTEAAQKYGLDLGDKQAVATAQNALQKFETNLAEVTRKTGALEQAETWLGKSKETQGILAPSAVGGFIAGPIGAAAGAASTFIGNSPQALAKRIMVEQAASRAQKVIGSTLDGFFDGAKKAMASTGEGISAGAARAPAALSRSAIPAATSLELFMGRHATPEAAYKARVEEIQAANQNYGERIRNNAGHVFGSPADHDPHAVGAAVVATTKAMQYLESKLPAPLLNTNSLTPTASRYVPSRMEIQQFADLHTAVSRPLDVIKSIPSGAVSPDQIQAIKQVYPRLYQYIRDEVMNRIQKLDQAGIEIPMRERIILDTALDLNGAGEPVFSAAFASKYGPAMADSAQAQQGQPQGGGGGGSAPSGTAKRTATKTEMMLGGG